MKETKTNNAPAAIGPYSQAITVGNMLFTSGQIPINPATGDIPEGVEAQAEQAQAGECPAVAAECLPSAARDGVHALLLPLKSMRGSTFVMVRSPMMDVTRPMSVKI